MRSTVRRSRKPKIKLNTNKVAILTVIIALVCIALLLFSVIRNAPQSTAGQKKTLPKTDSALETPHAVENQTETKEEPATTDETVADESPAPEPVKSSTPEKIPETTITSTATPAKSVAKTPSKPAASQKKATSEILPVKPQQGPTSPIVPYAIPEAVKGATLVFIFDDAGQSVTKVQRYTSLPFPLTIAVLPQITHSKECAEVIRKAGKEVMLHQPMQAENLKISPGPGAITPTMTTYEIAATLKKNLDEIGPVAGLNNHEGSLITEDEIKIGTVLEVAAERNLYFIDSRTTAATKAPQAALERDMHIFERDVFLDDVVNKDKILDQIYLALSIANKKGKVIIIGHVDKSVDIVPSLLRDMYPYLAEKGYKFAVPSKLK